MTTIKVWIATTSKLKCQAVKNAFQKVFPDTNIILRPKNVASLVNEQPVGMDETLEGCKNRLDAVWKQATRSGNVNNTEFYCVSIESGIIKMPKSSLWIDIGCVMIRNAAGKQSFATSTGIEFPLSMVEETDKNGFDSFTVGDTMLAYNGKIDPKDPHSTLTSQFMPRVESLSMALTAALGNLLYKNNKNV